MVVREQASSFTKAISIPSEKHGDLRDALILLIADLIPMEGPPAVVRTDPAPGFKSLINDEYLRQYRITLQIGRVKAPNKNPVAERAIQELEEEINRTTKPDGLLTAIALNTAVSNLNSRIRSEGLSSREMFFQRDQFTNEQIPVCDKDLIYAKHQRSLTNHGYSEKSKAHGASPRVPKDIQPGDLVYVYTDRNKHSPRDRYLVTSCDGEWCSIKKFTGNTLRAMSYKVKSSEIYKVPGDPHVDANSTRFQLPAADPDDYTDTVSSDQLPPADTSATEHDSALNMSSEYSDPVPTDTPPIEIATPPEMPVTPDPAIAPLDVPAPVTGLNRPVLDNVAAPARSQPMRSRRQPSRYKDYVM
jgi:hypothetical protein